MYIIMYGATDLGYMIASRLYLDHDITIIDDQNRLPDKFTGLDLSYVSGSGADIGVLENARAQKAELFIACTDLDEANVVACWTVKKMAATKTVCFVGRSEIYTTLTAPLQNQYQTPYDIDTVIWPEQLLTQDIFRTIMVRDAIDVEYFAEGRVKLFEYKIRDNSPLGNTRIMDYPFPDNVLVVGITKNGTLSIPNGKVKMEVDDKVIFMGTGAAIDQLAATIFHDTSRIRTATVIGGGNVGYYLAQKMEDAKIKVKILEHDKQRCDFLASNLSRSLVLHGDGTDIELLEEEAVGTNDVVVCVTNNDEKNLLCSLLAKQLGAHRIITRAENFRNAQLFDRVGIDVVVSPRESAMAELLNLLASKDVNILSIVGAGKAEILRIVVSEHFPPTCVKDLKLPADAVIGVIKRGKEIIIPDGNTLVYAEDLLKIFTLVKNTEKLKKVFER